MFPFNNEQPLYQRNGNHSPRPQLPITLIPTVVGNTSQLDSSAHNVQANPSEALIDSGKNIPSFEI